MIKYNTRNFSHTNSPGFRTLPFPFSDSVRIRIHPDSGPSRFHSRMPFAFEFTRIPEPPDSIRGCRSHSNSSGFRTLLIPSSDAVSIRIHLNSVTPIFHSRIPFAYEFTRIPDPTDSILGFRSHPNSSGFRDLFPFSDPSHIRIHPNSGPSRFNYRT